MTADILILSASYGAGHDSVASAVNEVIRRERPDITTEVRDYFDFVSPRLNSLVRFTYVKSVRHAPSLWGAFYRATHAVKPDSPTQKFLNSLGRDELLGHLTSQSSKLVVCTYPTPAGVISTLRNEGRLDVPVVTVVTDYAVHSQWVHPEVDRYLVPSESVAGGLIERGIDEARVEVTGLPISPKFSSTLGKSEMRQKHGLDEDRPVVLVMAGAYGMLSGVTEVVEECVSLPERPQVLVVCGRSPKMKQHLEGKFSSKDVVALGFVDYVDELFEAADVLITKAGGITVSEALAKKIPMIIYRPIPGQEDFNTQYLLAHGAGLSANDREELRSQLALLLGEVAGHVSIGLISRLKEAATRIRKPDAALTAGRSIIGMYDDLGMTSALSGPLSFGEEIKSMEKITERV